MAGGSLADGEAVSPQLWQVSSASTSSAPLTQVGGEQLARYLKFGY